MKIISWNVNGMRAVERKKALEVFLYEQNPDVVCFQEIKMSEEKDFETFRAKYTDYDQFYHPAEKKGYAGTSIWAKKALNGVFSTGMPNWNDTEGRICRVDVGDISILGVYFPNGGKSEEAWNQKLAFYDCFLAYMNDLQRTRTVFWGGDVNCAHNAIDLARPKGNEGKIGFHPRERSWLDRVAQQNWVDIYRKQHPEGIVYSWWHVISRARARNVGWRIDYWFCDKKTYEMGVEALYLTDVMGSDHCPVQITV